MGTGETDPLVQVGAANEDIHQVVTVFEKDEEKWPWLLGRLQNMYLTPLLPF